MSISRTAGAPYRAPTQERIQVASPVDAGPRVLAWLAACVARARQRRALARLDDRLLRDIGLSSADVADELAKPFWRD
jgi:uncharacterized protein YjiS (DUF1127 family)